MFLRIFIGLIVGGFYGMALWFSPIVWACCVCITTVVCNFELKKIFKNYRYAYYLVLIINLVLLIFTSLACIFTGSNWKMIHEHLGVYQNIFILSGIVLIIIYYLLLSNPKATLPDVACTIFGIIYIGWLPSYLILFRAIPNIQTEAFFLMFSVAMCDAGAFFTGKFLGRHPFFSHISPKKTVEGAIGGLLTSVIILLLASPITHIIWYHSLILGILVAVTAQMGDLTESFLKRTADIKDSGDFLPSHGGILDRVDSYIFVGPLIYYYSLFLK